MSDTQLVDWTLTHPAAAPSYLSALPVAVRRQVGEELGHRLGEGDPYDDLELLEGLGEDEVVATSALESLGAAGLVALTTALVPRGHDIATQTQRRLVGMRRAVGTMLATGNADDEAPGARRVSDAWLRGLAREVSSRRRDGLELVTPRRGFAPVLRYAAQSTAALTTIGTAILQADRASQEAPSPLIPAPEDLREELSPTMVTDPVAEVMEAASDNPEAARQLLGDTEALQHLLVDRRWDEYDQGPDIGALGRALENATTDARDERSVAIAEQTIDALRQRFDELPGKPDVRADVMDPRLRPHVGAMLGEYLPALHDFLGGLSPGEGIPDAGPRGDLVVAGPVKEAKQTVSLLLADVGKDSDAGRLLVAQANGHAVELLVHELRGVPAVQFETRVRLAMTNVIGPHSDLIAAVDHGLVMSVRTEQVEADAAADAAHRDRVVRDASVAKYLVAQIPMGGDALGMGIDIARAEALAARADSSGATNLETGLLFSTGEEDQRILVDSVVAELVPPDLHTDLRLRVENSVEIDGGHAYRSGRFAAWLRLSNFE